MIYEMVRTILIGVRISDMQRRMVACCGNCAALVVAEHCKVVVEKEAASNVLIVFGSSLDI